MVKLAQLKTYLSPIFIIRKLREKGIVGFIKRGQEIMQIDQAQKYCEQAHELGKESNYQAAITYYQKAQEIAPNWDAPYYFMGNIYFIQQKFGEAIDNYQKALEINPDLADAQFNLAQVCEKIGQLDKALINYEKALTINPNWKEAQDKINNLTLMIQANQQSEASNEPKLEAFSDKDLRILQEGQNNLRQTLEMSPSYPFSLSQRWSSYLEKIAQQVFEFKSVLEGVKYAQSEIGFEGRGLSVHTSPYFSLYDFYLTSEFPEFQGFLQTFSDSPNSRQDTIVFQNNRYISNIVYLQARVLLNCLRHTEKPETVCEIGAGYGLLAKLWLTNTEHNPKKYIIIDFPQCLFFAETFLKSSCPDVAFYYCQDGKIPADILEEKAVIFCPIHLADKLENFSTDLVINVGSMQEMYEDALQYWMDWLDRMDCRYFFSENYFNQPLKEMYESSNSWSPRPSKRWKLKHYDYNPGFSRLQTNRNVASTIYVKDFSEQPVNESYYQAQLNILMSRSFSGPTFLEMMEIVRHTFQEDLMLEILLKSIEQGDKIPKESMFLVTYLLESSTESFREQNSQKLQEIKEKLQAIKTSGIYDSAAV